MDHQPANPARSAKTRALGGDVVAAGRERNHRANGPWALSEGREFRALDVKRNDLTGVSLGSLDLGAKLAEGGMGSLFLARHRQLGRACVVKFIHPSVASHEQAIRRFLQEIQAIGQLNHPHIVSAIDAGCADGVHYYVTEQLQGQDLQTRVADQGPIRFEESCAVLRQILDGLKHVHDQGFIHRDIKPSNLFLTREGHGKLLDFGLVRNLQKSDGLTQSEQMLGTLDYLAPEQAQDPTSATEASDIYSLGLTWIYLLSGEVPFPDAQYPTTVSKLRGHLVDEPPWIHQALESLPAGIPALISSMIDKSPEQRLRSCRHVLERLDACSAAKESAKRLSTMNGSRPRPKYWSIATKRAGAVAVAVMIAVASMAIPVATGDRRSPESYQTSMAQEANEPMPPPSQLPATVKPVSTTFTSESPRTLSSGKPTANARVFRPTTGIPVPSPKELSR